MEAFRSNKPSRHQRHTTGTSPFDNRPSSGPAKNTLALRTSTNFDLVKAHVERSIVLAESRVTQLLDIRTEAERPRMDHTLVNTEQAARIILHQEKKQ